MQQTINFDRVHADFTSAVLPSERTSAILGAVDRLLYDQQLGYRLEDFLGAPFSAVNLASGQPGTGNDLIFKMVAFGFFEIVICDQHGRARPGGWLAGMEPVRITGQVANGFHVVATDHDGTALHHAYSIQGAGYLPQFGDRPVPLACAKRLVRALRQ